MNLDSKIYIAGHRDLAGSAIGRELQRQGYAIWWAVRMQVVRSSMLAQAKN